MRGDLIVRLAEAEDAPVLVDFARAMARETEAKELSPDVVSAGVAALLRSPERGFYIVAEQGGLVVGSLMITFEWSDWRNGLFWWIQSVYVRPESRREGILSSLYEYVKADAEKEPEVCGFRLYVERENQGAQKAYDALGMSQTPYEMYEQLRARS